MTKSRKNFTPEQKQEYVKLMLEEGYSNQAVADISGACLSAVARWKWQYKQEIAGLVPKQAALTEDKRRIQDLEKQLARAQRDNEILKKAAAFFIRDDHSLR